MESNMNEKLSEKVVGILISAILVQLLDLAVAAVYPQLKNTRTNFSIGLWIGAAVAVVMAVMVYRAIPRALKMDPEKADRYMKRIYAARALLMLIAAAAVYYLPVGYVMSAFIGMLCLQFGGVFQPLIHKIVSKEKPF